MRDDIVDDILNQWSAERPELDTAGLGVVIRVAALSRFFSREAAKALEPLGMELFEYDALSALRRQGEPFALAATELARETDLSSGAMTNRIDRLEEQGWVERRPDENDRRSVIVRLTPAGKQAIDHAIQVRLNAADAGLQELTKSERRELARLLRVALLSTQDRD
jgi:DNA-binding MarR family transcriptional regulator